MFKCPIGDVRAVQVGQRLLPHHFEQLKSLAAQAGIPVGAYLRQITVDHIERANKKASA